MIRPARPKDLPAIFELYGAALDDEPLLTPLEARKLFAKMRRYPNYKVYVYVERGRIAGTFALLVMDNLGHRGAPSAIVEDVAVAPELQGRGIGRKMMAFALARCRKAGCYKMALSSNSKRKKAHAFYENLGFKRHGYSFLVEP